MPTPRTDLSAFATGLAARLPGPWTSTYQHHAAYKDQYRTNNQLWDSGHVDYVVSTYVLPHEAVLRGPEGERLYVTHRPRYSHQFVVAALQPTSDGLKPHHFYGVEEPHGIAVPSDPVRAAARVTLRLLPRYEQALHEVLHNAAEQPEPPHRPAPPQVPEVLTLTYYDDGALGVPYENVPPDVRMALFAHGFQYHPHQASFLLPAAYGEVGRALRVQALTQKLAPLGLGVNLRRHSTTRAAPPSTTTAQPASLSATRTSAGARHQ
ncbi:hypothetical protein OIC43_09450 [Streptomyces sp. NBC_00825]|uniref:hypothetical protein n=1 Tax=unclassified Streptomyces TaxID=2593676 RepID=UPI002ED5385C|nr:hypothetical protein OG832_34245 [Streptomyces sp. NBC_00826]WTH89248.1 hypothetical protein OIC43_09450 [Streptomyces sp. NBC_00825]WTH97973.1 hypothetical protein OHA23_09435 [Streptomyces sp. NBC_00822]